jgi:membrane fusion protein (multidrug efflux system)
MIRFLLLFWAALASAIAVEIPAAKPERGTIHRWVTLPATFSPWQQVELRARVDGYVKSVAVDSGDVVKPGQILIEIEVPELQADLIRHEAEVTAADAAAKRLNEAFAKSPDLVLPQDVDDAEARLAVAKANQKRAETLLDFAQIKAPFAATVTDRLVDPGAYASAGAAPLLRLADTATLRLQVPIVELESGLVRKGQPIEAKVEALGGAVLAGTVSRVSGILDLQTRTMMIEADFPNPDGRLRPGMFATARVGVERHDGATLIPAAGLVKEKTATFVFKHAAGKAVKTPVKVGFADGVKVEVPELTPDDLILLPGTTPLTDGQAVTIK